MNYEPFPEDVRIQCKRMRLVKDIIGGLVKKGTVVWAYHKFRIYIPKDPKKKEPTDPLHEPPTEAARYEFDGQLFDTSFVPVDPPPKPKKEPAKSKVLGVEKFQVGG